MDLAEIKNRRRTGNQRDGWLISHSEYAWLVSEVERLTTDLSFAAAREKHAEEGKLHYFNLMKQAGAERDRYKAALERIAEEANTGESGDAGVMRDAARESLSEVP